MSEDRSRAEYNSGKSLRILVVEDDAEMRALLQYVLDAHGHPTAIGVPGGSATTSSTLPAPSTPDMAKLKALAA